MDELRKPENSDVLQFLHERNKQKNDIFESQESLHDAVKRVLFSSNAKAKFLLQKQQATLEWKQKRAKISNACIPSMSYVHNNKSICHISGTFTDLCYYLLERRTDRESLFLVNIAIKTNQQPIKHNFDTFLRALDFCTGGDLLNIVDQALDKNTLILTHDGTTYMRALSQQYKRLTIVDITAPMYVLRLNSNFGYRVIRDTQSDNFSADEMYKHAVNHMPGIHAKMLQLLLEGGSWVTDKNVLEIVKSQMKAGISLIDAVNAFACVLKRILTPIKLQSICINFEQPHEFRRNFARRTDGKIPFMLSKKDILWLSVDSIVLNSAFFQTSQSKESLFIGQLFYFLSSLTNICISRG